MKKQVFSLATLALFLFLSSISQGDQPHLKWVYEGKGTLYAPPLATDVHPSHGLEILISDAEVRTLRCIDATGEEIWSFRGDWKKRLTAGAAVSHHTSYKGPVAVIPGSDGLLWCVDAGTGRGIWKREIGSVTWGSALWADLDGDGLDEVVAGTEGSVVALDDHGKERWTFQRSEGDPSLNIQSPICSCDIDGDGKSEIFGLDQFAVFCLRPDGTPRWVNYPGDVLSGPLIVSDIDHDSCPELFCGMDQETGAMAWNADEGTLSWRFPMPGSPTGIATGNLDHLGNEEIVVADDQGLVHALRADGALLWSARFSEQAGAGVSLGDVDGDDEIEILLASGDHWLYCLDSTGRLEWRSNADLRILGTATIADVDRDGKIEWLFCGSDHKLRCLSLDAPWNPALVPWPSSRVDERLTGSAFARKKPSLEAAVFTFRPLLAYSDFETAQATDPSATYPKESDIGQRRTVRPAGWVPEKNTSVAWRLDADPSHDGSKILNVAGALILLSNPVPVDTSLHQVSAKVRGQGPGTLSARLRWCGTQGILREDDLAAPASADDGQGWVPLQLEESLPPQGALTVCMVLETGAKGGCWAGPQLRGTFRVLPKAQVLVNQVGYDVGAPKRFTVQTNFEAEEDATFSVIEEDGTETFSGKLSNEGRILGHFGNDWGHAYWRGDFSSVDKPGRYNVRVSVGEVSSLSWPFEIGGSLIWERTARPAYRFFTYQRCGCEVPGFHAPCHLDDGITIDGTHYDLSGGWHDAGDYNTYQNAPYVYGLARAYGIQRKAFDGQDEDGNGIGDFLEEILWGGDHSRRMIAPNGSAFGAITSGYGFWGPPSIETDNLPDTGDERPLNPPGWDCDSRVHAAAMARIATFVEDKDPWIEAAERAVAWSIQGEKKGPHLFSACVDLYAATGQEKYARLARELLPRVAADETIVDAIQRYDDVFGEDHSEQLRRVLKAKAEETLKLADNPFGVLTFGPVESPNFFGTPKDGNPWRVGTNSHLCQGASLMALAHAVAPNQRYLAFIYDQINWILGTNPFNVSLMEGTGSTFVPTYHNRLLFAGVPRGAVPGSVINGITCERPGKDVPYLDMSGVDIPNYSANECWLPHNTHYLNLLANLKAIDRSAG